MRALARPPVRASAAAPSTSGRPHASARRAGTIKRIETFPLKGARGERLESARIRIGSSTPRDREFALLRGENARERWRSDDARGAASEILLAGVNKDPGHHSNKHLFHQLITDPSLAAYRGVAINERGLAIACAKTGEVLVRCEDYDEDIAGRGEIETFFATRLETAISAPTLTRAEGHSFANVGGRPSEHVLHINTVPSVRAVYDSYAKDLGEAMGETFDEFAMRFRPNIVVEDDSGNLRPFDEFDWCGHHVRIGRDVILRVNEPTIRCPSTRVRYDDSENERVRPDVDIRSAFPNLRASVFGRDAVTLAEKGSYLGLYAVAVVPGDIAVGDAIEILEA